MFLQLQFQGFKGFFFYSTIPSLANKNSSHCLTDGELSLLRQELFAYHRIKLQTVFWLEGTSGEVL